MKRIVIIEDELHNQRLLQGMIKQLRPAWMVVETIESVYDATNWFAKHSADLIFMDIQLVDGICFSIFDNIQIMSPVIFTTAYDNYAIQAFKVNSIDYLLKPIKENHLLLAIEKFEQFQKPSPVPFSYNDIVNAIKKGEKKYRTRFMIQAGVAYYKLDANDIAYLYSENKITYAVSFDAKQHHIDFTLEALEEEMDPDAFFRVNRQMMVNINAVVKFEDYFGGKLNLKIKPPFKESVTISRLKNAQFKDWVGK